MTEAMGEAKPDRLLGRTIAGKYRIEAKIGQGGMGSVYRARHLGTGKVVALKVLLEDLAAYPSFVERFLHEARAAAYVMHPHAINIIDCGREEEIVYLLMEYLEGETLAEVLKREGPFSPQRAARILRQICSAVAEAHAQGIIHRDLKPANIILQQVAGEKDYVKVLDFGIAKVLDEQKRGALPISRSVFVGTPEYASPEQCNAKSPTVASDIYSLGVILYEMLAGRPPFEGDPMDVMLKHVHEEPPPLRVLRPELSPEMEAVVLRALHKDPAARPQSAWELAEEFERAVRASASRRTMPLTARSTMERLSPSHTRPQELAAPTVRWARRRWGMALIGALLLAGASGLGYRAFRWLANWPSLPMPPAITPKPAPRWVLDPVSEARRLFEEGDREGATILLREAIAQGAFGNALAHELLGLIYFDQGETAWAKSEILLALEHAGGMLPEAHLHLGRLLLEEGEVAGAERAFRTALEQSRGRLIAAAAALGELYLRQGRREEAERVMREALQRAGEDPHDLVEVGRILMLQGQYELAVRELRRAIRLKNGVFPQAYLLLGRTLLELGEANAAAEVLSTALAQRRGNDPAARHLLGRTRYRLRDYDRALADLHGAIHLRGGNYPEARYDLALVLSDPAVGRYEEAEEHLRAALTLRRDHFPEASEALAQIYALRLGRLEEARRLWLRMATRSALSWLERTRDAMGLHAPAEWRERMLRTEVPAQLTFELALAPSPTERQLTVLFRSGDIALGLRLERERELSPWSVRPARLLAAREEVLEPLDDSLDLTTPLTLTLTSDRTDLALALNGREIVRVKRSTAASNAPLLWGLRGGRALLFHVRE
ncbi:MAG: protein kinase [Blastocatellia bacterium]|nr:protein kinase [Blastocatellia bacterium]MCS7156605.1 protein kinase [Blastocatellia bacterium]MCX7751653.1 protein kinase [Blastocatellia bacterium]MDW8168753.1 protein kinase [Acidobacteriota bacterium]MDW8257019.1 protein kinase [Acidobacteriota bacterium]